MKTSRTPDILIVNLPPWAQENPHIGIAYLGAYLRSRGLVMDVLDLNKHFCLRHPDFTMLWHVENKNFWSNKESFSLILDLFKVEIDEAVNKVASSACRVIGFSVVDPKERLTIELIRRIKDKAPEKKIILGGPATSTCEQRQIFLDNVDKDIDVFVLGEGEKTLFTVLGRILEGRELNVLEGCCTRGDSGWICKEKLILRKELSRRTDFCLW